MEKFTDAEMYKITGRDKKSNCSYVLYPFTKNKFHMLFVLWLIITQSQNFLAELEV